jgi:hypothetical protein
MAATVGHCLPGRQALHVKTPLCSQYMAVLDLLGYLRKSHGISVGSIYNLSLPYEAPYKLSPLPSHKLNHPLYSVYRSRSHPQFGR